MNDTKVVSSMLPNMNGISEDKENAVKFGTLITTQPVSDSIGNTAPSNYDVFDHTSGIDLELQENEEKKEKEKRNDDDESCCVDGCGDLCKDMCDSLCFFLSWNSEIVATEPCTCCEDCHCGDCCGHCDCDCVCGCGDGCVGF